MHLFNVSPTSSPISSPSYSPSLSPEVSPTSEKTSPGLSDALRTVIVFPPEGLEARRNLFGSQNPLEKTKEKISRSNSPPLKALKKSNANDVFFISSPTKVQPHSVFKPGKDNTIRAMLCAEVAKILGLEDCVPQTIQATAAEVISKEDLDDTAEPIVYKTVYYQGVPYLCNPDDCFKITSGEGAKLSLDDGSSFTVIKDEHSTRIKPINKQAKFHDLANKKIVIISLDEERYVVKPKNITKIITGASSPHIERAGARFELRLSQDAGNSEEMSTGSDEDEVCAPSKRSRSFKESTDDIPKNSVLIRKNVEGLLQPMVQNIFTEIEKDRPINILNPNKSTETFYGMINRISFINSFVLAVLFRTQDGKASNLDDSNFLFSKVEGQLSLTLIDLDETWPVDNGLTEDPELREKGEIAALRLGLMGYPHAHEELQNEYKTHLSKLLEKIKQNQGSLVTAIDKYVLPSQERIKRAFEETLQRLAEFHAAQENNTATTLADLVFHVFPVYKQQWDQLKELGISREEISVAVGFASVAEKKEETQHRAAMMSRNKSITKK